MGKCEAKTATEIKRQTKQQQQQKQLPHQEE